jgi:hypothetical protein
MRPFRRTHKSEIEAIRIALGGAGAVVNVLHQSGRLHGTAGMPDLYIQVPPKRTTLCGCDGFAFWVEVKVGRDKLRREQVAFAIMESSFPPPHREVVIGGLKETVDYYNAKRPNHPIRITG